MVNDIPLAVERFVGNFGIKAIHLAYKHVKCPQTVSVVTRGGLKVGSLIQAKKGCLAQCKCGERLEANQMRQSNRWESSCRMNILHLITAAGWLEVR
jgi:hypothetical protein